MEAATTGALYKSCVGVYRPSISTCRSVSLAANGPDFVRFSSANLHSPIKRYSSVSYGKQANGRAAYGSRRYTAVRASSSESAGASSSEPAGSSAPIAPLQLESPIGQFLSQILIDHPHLVPAAVEQQLEQLQTDREAETQKEEPPVSGTDLVLYRRIAEVKANERRKVLEEILYALVVQKFMDANVSLVPSVAPLAGDPSNPVDISPSQNEKLERLHSPEAYEMILNHLVLILGNRTGDSGTLAQISKLRVGQVYAASVMYGYFLKRVDQRFQLEKSMKILPSVLEDADSNAQEAARHDPSSAEEAPFQAASSHPEVAWSGGDVSARGFTSGIKNSRLRSYVMSFDGETLQRYATIRSKEAVSIIEKHTEALFGRPEVVITPEGTVDSSKDEPIKISFGSLNRLVLEAVTFGSFLWDVESNVDSRYHFVMN